MKIRTDFVTNSSSSSFVAMLDVTLDNGEELTASAETSQGGEEGGWISAGITDYEMDTSQICSIDEFCNKGIEVDGQVRHIKYGSLRLMCHTYGEYAYEADPERLLTNYLGKVWGFLIDQMDKSLSEKQQFKHLREIPFLNKYTDNALKNLIHFIYEYGDESGSDTEIIQSLRPDGMLDIEIETGEGLFDTYDAFDFDSFDDEPNHPKGKLVLSYDGSSQQKHVSITIGRNYYSGTEEEIDFILQSHKKEYAAFAERMEKATHLSIDEYLRPRSFLDQGRIEYARENLDLHELVTFAGKRFVISVNSESIDFRAEVEKEIKRRGGIPLESDYMDLNPDADYLIVSPFHSNFRSAMDIQDAIKKRGEGYRVKIITDYQLWCGFMDKSIHVQSDEEMMSFIGESCSEDPELQKKLEGIWETVCSYGYEDAFRDAVENLDVNVEIVFMNRHFVVSGFGEEEPAIIEQIEERGGIVHDKMVKMADYLVICMRTPGSYKLQQALEWRKKGAINCIVSEYQLAEALEETKPVPPEVLRQREEDLRRQEEEKKEAIRRMALEREKKKEEQRRMAEERLRLAQEAQERREEERRKRQEIAQQLADERKRQQEEREKEKLEKERATAEAKAQKERERQEAIASAHILYEPGQEPENIRRRIRTLCEKLDAAYPDRRISGLYNDHKKWGETVTELRRILGYVDNTTLLEAYGYTVIVNDNKGGRPTTTNPDEIIGELKRRYPNGAGPVNIQTLKDDNPDLPWKTLQNNATTYFGKTLVAYLKTIGIIGGTMIYAPIQGSDSNQKTVAEGLVESEKVPVEMDSKPAVAQHNPNSGSVSLDETAEDDPTGQVSVSVSESTTNELTESDKKYLATIIQLSQGGATVKATDIALSLGVSKPSVSVAIKHLCEKGYIYYDYSKNIHLLNGAIEASLIRKEEGPAIDSSLAVQLSESEKKYVWAIEQLQKENGIVRSVDIANVLGVSKPSVSVALKKLRDRGIVTQQTNGSLTIVTTDDSPALSYREEKTSTFTQRAGDEQARREAEEQARREAEEQARREAEEKARREAEEQARREAEEKARREAEEQARREAEEQARREAEEKARREAEEQARREAEEQARREAEEQARREAEEKARREAEEQARREAEEKARREAEERAKQEAEKKARQDAEETQRRAAEAQRIAEKARIRAEILDLTNEMNSLKGLFAGMKRKKLQKQIDELNEQLHRI